MQNPTPETTSTKVTVVCKTCGKEFRIKRWKAKSQSIHFCCRTCYDHWRKVINRISQICPICHRAFNPRPNRFKKGNDKFCSKPCFTKSIERPLEERFWEKVNKAGPVPTHRTELGNCWTWIGAKTSEGYGQIKSGPKNERTHRIAWIIQNGSIPNGKVICHACDNPSCVRVSHLFQETQQGNMDDCVHKGRKEHGEQHYKSKLTEKDVIFIRSSNLTQKALSEMFHVSAMSIWGIVHRLTWKHVK